MPKPGQTNAKLKEKSHTLARNFARAWLFCEDVFVKSGFLDGKQGFLLAVLSAHSTFVKYADLWERDQHKH